MNKQRKVLITTTYNEMGIVIDTKAEEVAQPEILACGEGELNVPDTMVLERGKGMIPDEDCYLRWQYCRDLNEINKAIKEHDEDWEGLESLHQIISITYDTNHGCYVVFWIAYKGEQK